jgi:hypothetical protein
MPEVKDRQVMTNLEPTFYEIMQKVLIKEDMSASSYLRSLVIKDLQRRGLVTEDVLASVLLGRGSE